MKNIFCIIGLHRWEIFATANKGIEIRCKKCPAILHALDGKLY